MLTTNILKKFTVSKYQKRTKDIVDKYKKKRKKNSEETLDPLYIENYNKLLKHHDIMLYQALSTQMPYDEYEEFIDQPHLGLQNLDDAYDYRTKRSSISSEKLDYCQRQKEEAIYKEQIRLPYLGEIITPAEEERLKACEASEFDNTFDIDAILNMMKESAPKKYQSTTSRNPDYKPQQHRDPIRNEYK